MPNLAEIFVPLHRIIPFSNVEGIGNRTSIFLQGCKLNCLYCHNPETIPRYAEGAKLVSLQYLFDAVMEARPFIRGVTFSGGEPTLHQQKLLPLCQALHAEGLSVYVDTSGFFEFNKLSAFITETDKFLFDLKGEGEGLGRLCFDRQNRAGRIVSEYQPKVKSSNLARNLDNLRRLLPLGKVEEVRLVYLRDFFDAKALVLTLSQILKPYPEVLFKLIRVHAKGARDPKGLAPFVPSMEETQALADLARAQGLRVQVIF